MRVVQNFKLYLVGPSPLRKIRWIKSSFYFKKDKVINHLFRNPQLLFQVPTLTKFHPRSNQRCINIPFLNLCMHILMTMVCLLGLTILSKC